MNQRLKKMLYLPNLKTLLSDPKYLSSIHSLKASFEARKEYIFLRGFVDFEFFVTTFFQPYCQAPFSRMHEDFFKDETDPTRRGRREVIAAPRGHAKTTFKVTFKTLHAIVYEYEKYVLIIGHSAREAESKVNNILNELEENTLIKEIYGNLAPKRGQKGYSRKNFVTQNGIRVEAKSRGAQVRGMGHGASRPTLIVLDDIESPEGVLTEEQRYKTKQWLEKDILKLGDVSGKDNIVVIGTCLHPEALLPELLSTPGWQGRRYQAVDSFATNQALWAEWKALYTDLANPNREAETDAFFEANQQQMLEGTQVLWPEAEPYAALMKMRIREGEASFQSEKQNEPYDPTRQIFDMDAAARFKVEYRGNGELAGFRWIGGKERYVAAHEIIRMVAFHDPAMAENQDSDYAAIVVCAGDNNGYIYCLDAYIEKVPPSKQIARAFDLHQKWNFDRLYLEDNNFQGLLKRDYRNKQEETGIYLRVSGMTQIHNKEKRIASLEPLISNRQLLFNIDLNPRLMSQMKQFPNAKLDGPDALHGAVEPLRKSLRV